MLSAGFCSSLLSEGKCYLHPGRGGTGFTLEPVPETVDKAEMQGFLRKRRRIPTSFRFLACKSQAHVYITRPVSVADTDQTLFPSSAINISRWPFLNGLKATIPFNCKSTRLAQHGPLHMANTTCQPRRETLGKGF